MSEHINQKIIELYQESGMSIEEIISSLKQLLATAQISSGRVDNDDHSL